MNSPCPRCAGTLLPDGTCPRCLAAMAERPSGPPLDESPLAPGDYIAGLEIEGLIARGGMGVVYKARRPGGAAALAVKVLPRALAVQAEFRGRFELEVRAMASLAHPHIVGIHDYGIERGLPFLVMDYVEGCGLRPLLRRGRLPFEETVRLATEVLEALEAAHEQGVVHRDLKPDNILLDTEGRVKMTDFGLAKLIGNPDVPLTESNLVIGTPHYMAPEQLDRPREVDRRADVYSFGVLLYEMLTGGLPIGRFALPSEKGAGKRDLDAVVLRCLEADPSKRFPDASSLKHAFLRAVGSAAGDALPPRAARPRHSRNNPITCAACSWTFFVADVPGGFVNCPNCRAPVPLGSPAKRASTTTAPPPVAQPVVPPRRALPAAVAALSAVLLLGGLSALFAIRRALRPATAVAAPSPRGPEGIPPPARPPEAPASSEPSAPSSFPGNADVVDFDARIARHAQQCNMAAIVGAILLQGGKLDEFRRVEDRIGVFHQEIRLFERRRSQLRQAAPPVPPHVDRGDRVVGLDEHRLSLQEPRVFADALKGWLQSFKAGRTARILVMRGEKASVIHAEFPERTKDLNALAHLVDVILGESNRAEVAPPPPDPGPLPLPSELLAEVKRSLSGLHPYHRERILSLQQDRPRRLLEAASGNADDIDFLRQRILSDLAPAAATEIENFRTRVAALEPLVMQGGAAPADTVVFKDGRRLEGAVDTLPEGRIRIRGKLGSITVPEGDVLRIEKGKGVGAEFPPRWAAAQGKAEPLAALLQWCGDRGLKEARLLTAHALLLADPGHEPARIVAGYLKNGAGGWERGDPTAGVNGTIEWHGRVYTPEELARELGSLGYVRMNGLWYTREQTLFRMDNLYRDTDKLILREGTLQSQLQEEKNMVYDVRSRSWVPKTRTLSTGRYLAGRVVLECVAPGELLECRVRARGQVSLVGSSLAVFVALSLDEKNPRLLYSVSAPGEHWQSIDVTDRVRGTSKFYLLATAGPGTLFLPGDSNDLGTLEIRYTWAQPLKRLNDFLGGRPLTPAAPPSDATAVEAVIRRQAEVVAGSPLLTTMLTDMRTFAERLSYPRDIDIPSRFQGLTAMIEDPLRPKLESRPTEQLLQLGEWWGALPLEDRRAFAYTYGLWCARWRALGR